MAPEDTAAETDTAGAHGKPGIGGDADPLKGFMAAAGGGLTPRFAAAQTWLDGPGPPA